MKILYFGTVCNHEGYDRLFENSKCKPSVAPLVFETALLEGMYQNNANVQIHSFPMIPTFPNINKFFFGREPERLSCGYEYRWLRTVNVPFLKQISRRMDARRVLKKWCLENKDDGVILLYSIPPFLAGDVVKHGKKYGVKTIAIVADLPRDMYINEKKRGIMYFMKKKYLNSSIKVQGKFDAYVYLTEAMRDVVAPDKPYIVMEGIADVSNVKPPSVSDKSTPRAIMYAGMLHEKYGILNLLDAFEKLTAKDVELWLFGDGTAVAEIKKRAEVDRRIKFFGVAKREEILMYERRATLLVNPRDPSEDFTKYSFPSKTIEYMLSGTPLLTTRLKGIPEEYYSYVFCADSSSLEMARIIDTVLANSPNELNKIGERAQAFIVNRKNSNTQAARIMNFLGEV